MKERGSDIKDSVASIIKFKKMHINSNILISKFNDIKYITFYNFFLTNLNKGMHTVVLFLYMYILCEEFRRINRERI